jgi:voltage-gated potassium channel
MEKEKIGLYVDIVMLALALITIFLLFYEMTILRSVTPETRDIITRKVLLIHRLDLLICIIFIVEFVVRSLREEDKKAFVRTHWLEIPGMIPFTVLGVSKTFRILRLFRLIRVFSLMKRFSRLYQKRFVKNELQYATVIIVTILIFASYGIYFFEAGTNPEISSIGDAVWWSIVTVTTVGYGDKVPITPLGKAIGVILMFTGIGLIGIISGTIASTLLSGYRSGKEREEVDEAMRALKIRRAKGEVTEDQYREIKQDLEDIRKKRT